MADPVPDPSSTTVSMTNSSPCSGMSRLRTPVTLTMQNSTEAESDHDLLTPSSTSSNIAANLHHDVLSPAPFRNINNHFQMAFVRLSDFRKRKQLCDTVLLVGDTEIHAHRAVLAACSPYFAAMFTSSLAESSQRQIILQGLSGEAVAQLVNFMYTSEVKVTEDTVQHLLPSANLLQLYDVVEVCCEFLQTQLHPSNCLGIQQFADLHHCTELFTHATQFIEQHFTEVLKYEDEFLNLPFAQLDALLSSDRLAVKEEDLLEGVIRWVDHQLQPCSTSLATSPLPVTSSPTTVCAADVRRLLRRVRYPLLSTEYLVRITMQHSSALLPPGEAGAPVPTPLSSSRCADCLQEYLIEAMRFHLMNADDRQSLCQFYLQQSSSISASSSSSSSTSSSSATITSANHEAAEADQSQLSFPDTSSSNKWTCQQQPRSSSKDLSLASLFRPRVPLAFPKVLLVIGGQAPKAIRSVECFDFKTAQWFSLTAMPRRLCRCGVALLNNQLYVIGGFNGAQRLLSCERYNPMKSEWTPMQSMTSRRSTLGVGVMGGRIYAVGGFDGMSGFATVEVFTPPMPTMASGSAGGASGSGGASASLLSRRSSMAGVESSPSMVTLLGRWDAIASMQRRRSSVGVAVFQDRWLFAVGGYDGSTRQCLASVERYEAPATEFVGARQQHSDESSLSSGVCSAAADSNIGVWLSMCDMHFPRSGCGVAVLCDRLYAVGGHDGPLVRNSVEMYNPFTDQWTLVANMYLCRRNAGVVSYNNYLYVVGGDDGSSNLNSMECYDSKADKWILMSTSMNTGRSYSATIVVDRSLL